MSICGDTLMAQLAQLAGFSETCPSLTRTYLTPVHHAAGLQLMTWMREAGMTAAFDAVGNVVGHYAGKQPNRPVLLLGSHYDTVRDAGRYDGSYGIVAAIACVKMLHDNNERLPFAIDIVAFADEEGVRFNATLLGSRAVAGIFDLAVLDNVDDDGMTLRDALCESGYDPAQIATAAYRPEQVLAYVELHIEQGPVLLSESLPLGVVTAIAGATRLQVVVDGLAGHAGTVPMSHRRDAVTAAAEVVLAIERRCSAVTDLVGTVGRFEVPNGAINVVSGKVLLSVDIRSGTDALREAAVADILIELQAIAARRTVRIEASKTHQAAAVACAPWLIEQLQAAVERAGIAPRRLLSGAGHDAMALQPLTAIGMLFVRCGNGGISHHPDETMTASDAECGVTVLLDFVRQLRPVIS